MKISEKIRRWLEERELPPQSQWLRGEYLVAIVLALNTADYYTTLACLERGYQELNPLMAALLNNPFNYMLVKTVIVTAFFLFAFRWLEKKSKRALRIACLIVAGMFAAAVVNNIWWLL